MRLVRIKFSQQHWNENYGFNQSQL